MQGGFFVAGNISFNGMEESDKRRNDCGTLLSRKPADPIHMTILYRLQASALMWAVTITLMIVDDAAMLAMMFC